MRSTRKTLFSHAGRGLPLLLVAACTSSSMRPPQTVYTPLACGQGTGASETVEIGRAGGTVTVRGHSLTVPRGGVNENTPFEITELDTTYIGVEVGPSGKQFANGNNATLSLSYARCEGDPAASQQLYIAQVRSGTTHVLRVLHDSYVDAGQRTVNTPALEHLSGYLIVSTRQDTTPQDDN